MMIAEPPKSKCHYKYCDVTNLHPSKLLALERKEINKKCVRNQEEKRPATFLVIIYHCK